MQTKYDIRRGAMLAGSADILYMRHARAVAGLTAGRAFIGLHAMPSLVHRQNGLRFGFIVTSRAHFVASERAIGRLRRCGHYRHILRRSVERAGRGGGEDHSGEGRRRQQGCYYAEKTAANAQSTLAFPG
jgi:hypothetical protein